MKPWGISLLAVLMAAPLLVVVTSPLHAPAPEWGHVAREMLPAHLRETLVLLGGTLALALFVAVPTAWLLARFDLPMRGIFRWALVMPLALPTYISAYTYAAMLGPTGSISVWTAEHWGFRPDIVGLPGLCLVLALALFPYIMLPVRAAFTVGMTPQLDAARLLGARPMRRFGKVALPLARPAIAGGALLLAMETLNDYGAVKYYGIRTLTTGIFRSWGGLYDTGSALRLGLALMGLVALLIWIERRTRRMARQDTAQVRARREKLRGWQAWMATAWCLLVWCAAAGLPLGKLLYDVFQSTGGAMPDGVLSATGNTLLVASLAALATLVVAVLFAYRDRHGDAGDPAIRLARLGYAIPGAVIAVGVMALAGAIDRQGVLFFTLIGSLGLLTYAFAVRFVAVGTQPLLDGLRQQGVELDEAARLMGASRPSTFLRVNLPLLRPAMAAAATLVAIDVIKELPLTLILRPFNFHTLSTLTYEMASIEQLREASWPALLIVLCGLLPVLLLERSLARSLR